MHLLRPVSNQLVVCALSLWAAVGVAQTGAVGSAPGADEPRSVAIDSTPSPTARTSIDPTLELLRRACAGELPDHSLFVSATPPCDRGLGASLRFERPPGASQIARLSEAGVVFERGEDGRLRQLGLVYPARLRPGALDALRAEAGLGRVEALWQPGTRVSLEITSELVGADSARRRPPLAVDGQGTAVALIDTGVDVLHPALFYADGGLYEWLDVNDNGAFDPGVDAVDLDGDGEADHNEILRVVDASVVGGGADGELGNADGILQTERDWLYADMNNDRLRNVGEEAGFNEASPAYGEPIFVVDDADRDGVLGGREKLVRLSTSKIATYVTSEQRFVRGENLIAAGSGGDPAALHGTGTAGIIAAGQPPYHQRVGIAPAAQLNVYGLGSVLMETAELPLSHLEQAVADGVDVVLHEWTNAFTQPLDGSTNFEAAMAAARQEGLVQVNPVGNLNLAGKHTARPIDAGRTLRLAFEVSEGFTSDDQQQPYQSVFGSLQWRTGDDLDVSLHWPGGDEFVVEADDDISEHGGVRIATSRETTPRGTTVLRFYLESIDDDQPLEVGQWAFEVSGAEQAGVVYGRITDAYSNWREGVGWSEPTSDQSTIAFPSTADAAIGVAAFAGRQATPIDGGAQIGELRRFSGRGPRIDGEAVVDIAAPDDPLVPLGATPRLLEAGWGRSWFTPFGGTSGAAPHVAGAAALLRHSDPSLEPAQIEARIIGSARASQLSPAPAELPDPGWGHGKLDVYGALFEASAPQHSRPEASVEGRREPGAVVWDASGSRDPDGGQLEFRFDLGYDGQWHGDWSSEAVVRVERAGDELDERAVVRVEVRDEHGARHGAVAVLEATAEGGADAGDAGLSDVGLQPPEGSCCGVAPARGLPGSLGLLVGSVLILMGRRRR
jgi:subtilisin family serine protease